jgi:hypothetical protein
MFEFDIDFKEHNVITYNSFKEGASYGNLFTNIDNNESRRGVSWLDYNASIISTIQKLVYWFKTKNNVRAKYLLIHPKLKQYIDKNSIDLKYSSFVLNTKLSVFVDENILCNKVVLVGEDSKTYVVITVFDEEDINKLG